MKPETAWTCLLAGPVAMAYGAGLFKLPEWLGGLRGATCSSAKLKRRPDPDEVEPAIAPPADFDYLPSENPSGVQSLVDEMLSQHRYALLLRPQLVGNLDQRQWARTQEALANEMCLVPEGRVIVTRNAGAVGSEEETSVHSLPLHVEAYYLERHAVTNGAFQRFVASGGYEQLAIWDQEVLPAVLDFVDQSGHPGPRFWNRGRPPRGEEKHPVVGVCWYEACAYARWCGKRLPSDAEWIKAGSWPVEIVGHPLLMRRFPWGEAMDRERANLWGSGPGRTVAVDQFSGGVSVGGVQQMIGNVWEWTADALETAGDVPAATGGNYKMKSVRGGAFDTYLDSQATCQFQSGDLALARKHNIGFRCAIALRDLSLGSRDSTASETNEATLAESAS